MTERTLRDQIADLPRYEPDHCDRMGNRSDMIEEPEGDWLSRNAVLRILDAHTAAQPAPDAVAEAAERVGQWVARHRSQRGMDHEQVHGYDVSPDGGILLRTSDLETLIAALAKEPRT